MNLVSLVHTWIFKKCYQEQDWDVSDSGKSFKETGWCSARQGRWILESDCLGSNPSSATICAVSYMITSPSIRVLVGKRDIAFGHLTCRVGITSKGDNAGRVFSSRPQTFLFSPHPNVAQPQPQDTPVAPLQPGGDIPVAFSHHHKTSTPSSALVPPPMASPAPPPLMPQSQTETHHPSSYHLWNKSRGRYKILSLGDFLLMEVTFTAPRAHSDWACA